MGDGVIAAEQVHSPGEALARAVGEAARAIVAACIERERKGLPERPV